MTVEEVCWQIASFIIDLANWTDFDIGFVLSRNFFFVRGITNAFLFEVFLVVLEVTREALLPHFFRMPLPIRTVILLSDSLHLIFQQTIFHWWDNKTDSNVFVLNQIV